MIKQTARPRRRAVLAATAAFICSLGAAHAAGAPGAAGPANAPGAADASGAAAATPAAPSSSCELHIAAAARRYDIPLAVFYAVGLQETGGRNGLQPFTMNVDGRTSSNASLPEALAAYGAATRRGARLIDIGCMQINVRYHGRKFTSIAAMFDPAANVDYAARFLQELRRREGSWTLAVARYNAGPGNNPAQKRYVCGVIRRMVSSGFGSWTSNASAFCGAQARADGPAPRALK